LNRQPIPWLSLLENRVLLQLLAWENEYRKEVANLDTSRRRYVEPPTTERFSKHFKIPHFKMLAVLNRLEKQGLILTRRRLSAGLSGNGYDGSLFSAVSLTARAVEALERAVQQTTPRASP
jgi:hypothetical protein